MAEPTLEECKKIAKIFCEEYNKSTGGDFRFKRQEEKKDDPVDFYIEDAANCVGIQHSRIQDINSWFESRALTSKVVAKLNEIGQRCPVKRHIHVKFDKIPKGDSEIHDLAQALFVFLVDHYGQSHAEQRFSKSDLRSLSIIFEFFSEFLVYPDEQESFRVIGCGNKKWEYSGRSVEEYIDYVVGQICHKQQRFGACENIILLFVVEPGWPNRAEIELIGKKVSEQQVPFKEVWMMNRSIAPEVVRLYP